MFGKIIYSQTNATWQHNFFTIFFAAREQCCRNAPIVPGISNENLNKLCSEISSFYLGICTNQVGDYIFEREMMINLNEILKKFRTETCHSFPCIFLNKSP